MNNFNPKQWCDTYNGVFIPDVRNNNTYQCYFIPSSENTTIDNKYYYKTDKNLNLEGWMPSRIKSNLAIGKEILSGEYIDNITSFNQAQISFCDMKGQYKCSTKCPENYYCYNKKCFSEIYPTSVLLQKFNQSTRYGNIETNYNDNISQYIFNFTNNYLKNGEITDGWGIKCS